MAARANALSPDTRSMLEYTRRSLLTLRRYTRTADQVMQADADALGRVQRALRDTAKAIERLNGRRWPLAKRKPVAKLKVLDGGRA